MDSGLINFNQKDKRQNALKRLILAKRDMDQAMCVLRKCLEIPSTDSLGEHLIAAAIVYYTRPFIRSRGGSTITGKLEEFDDQSFKELHELIKSCRNELIAHSDDAIHAVKLIPKGASLSVGSTEPIQLTSHGEILEYRRIPHDIVPAFMELCNFQRDRLRNKIEEQKISIFG